MQTFIAPAPPLLKQLSCSSLCSGGVSFLIWPMLIPSLATCCTCSDAEQHQNFYLESLAMCQMKSQVVDFQGFAKIPKHAMLTLGDNATCRNWELLEPPALNNIGYCLPSLMPGLSDGDPPIKHQRDLGNMIKKAPRTVTCNSFF